MDLASTAESGCYRDTQRAGVALDGLAHGNQPRPPTDNPFLGHHLPGRHVMETYPDTQCVVQVPEGPLVLENMYMDLKADPRSFLIPLAPAIPLCTLVQGIL